MPAQHSPHTSIPGYFFFARSTAPQICVTGVIDTDENICWSRHSILSDNNTHKLAERSLLTQLLIWPFFYFFYFYLFIFLLIKKLIFFTYVICIQFLHDFSFTCLQNNWFTCSWNARVDKILNISQSLITSHTNTIKRLRHQLALHSIFTVKIKNITHISSSFFNNFSF